MTRSRLLALSAMCAGSLISAGLAAPTTITIRPEPEPDADPIRPVGPPTAIRSKYSPHQGNKERLRRLKRAKPKDTPDER